MHSRMKSFCAKRVVSTYTCFDIGHFQLKKEEEDGEISGLADFGL